MGEIPSRSRTGFKLCLKPTNVEDLWLLAGIAPPDIRRDVFARVEKKKQESNVAHYRYGQTTTERRLKSRSCFLSRVRPADFHPKVIRCNEWQRRPNTKPHSCSANLTESLARGQTRQWTTWRCLQRLRTGVTCSKGQRKKWGICWNSRSLHIPAIWMTFYSSTKQCVEQWKTAV